MRVLAILPGDTKNKKTCDTNSKASIVTCVEPYKKIKIKKRPKIERKFFFFF